MRAMSKRLGRAALLAMLLVACLAACEVAVDRSLAIHSAAGTVYPGHQRPCSDRCDDMTAEILRWIDREAPGDAGLASLTWHTMVDEAGNGVLMNRSGGSTWLAVATLTDGSRIPLLVGCGVGLDTERCFAGR
jgi:hypothetical protein